MTHLIAEDQERVQSRRHAVDHRASSELVIATGPYSRATEGLSSVDEYGAGVAHQDLSEAVLRYSDASLLVLSESMPVPVSLSLPHRSPPAEGIEALRQLYGGGRVFQAAAAGIGEVARARPLLFLAAGTQFGHIGQVRYGLSGQPFPICAILHSAHWPNMLLNFAALALIAEPCDCLVATSRAGREVVEAALDGAWELLRHRLGSAARRTLRVEQIPLGVEEEVLQRRDRHASRELLGLPQEATIALYVGRLSESHKADLEPLFAAFRKLAASDETALLVIAGQARASNYRTVLADIAARYGLDGRVRFITDFPYRQKADIYSAADIFVSPVDNIQETFGISLVEAMAIGLPVVASDWSGYRDLVRNGVTGFLVPTTWNASAGRVASETPLLEGSHTAEHYLAQRTVVDVDQLSKYLQLLASSRELRDQMGAAGRARFLAEYSWRVIIEKFLDLWREQTDSARRLCRAQPGGGLDYNRLFSHYASEIADAPSAVVCESPVEAMKHLSAGMYAVSSAFLLEEILAVLAQCRPGIPQPLSGDGADSPLRADAITWLLKKGIVRTV